MRTDFVIDDRSLYNFVKRTLRFKIPISLGFQYIGKLVDLSNYIRNTLSKTIYISEDFLSHKIDNVSIQEHLLKPKHHNNRDAFLLLSVTINRQSTYNPFNHYDEELIAYDKGFTSLSYIKNKPAAYITNRTVQVRDWWNKDIHYKCYEYIDALKIYRNDFYSLSPSYDEAYNVKDVLWPNCYFHNEKTERFDNLCVSETMYLNAVFLHLDYINDHGQDDFKANVTPRDLTIKARTFGVEMSPESPNTRSKPKAMKERVITINGTDITCEWHSKITETTGRIHVNFNTNEPNSIKQIVKGKVIIGIFTDHLTT